MCANFSEEIDMSMTDKLKDTLSNQIDAWEKELSEQKAKLKNEYATQ